MIRVKCNIEVIMIYKVDGDILLSKAQAIAHGVEKNDPMNKGLALELSNKYPVMHTDFHRWCHQHNTKPGEAWMWTGPNNVRIVHLITQEGLDVHDHLHGKATLNNIRHALSALVKIIATEKLASIAIPRIATGVGDLEWDDVWPLIDTSLGGLAIPVYVYATYQPGKAADEPIV
jgi:O-acetyl-ADP-ribose deacetylase (regulator of RNase III)